MKIHFKNWLALIHLVIIICVYLSPLFIPWQYVLIIFILYRLQLYIWGGCILSNLQFGKKDEGFYFHYLKKVFPNITNKTIDLIVDNIIPITIIIIAYIIQNID